MITVGAIWRCALERHQRRALLPVDQEPLPCSMLAVLNRVFSLASERRPLGVSDINAFAADNEACYQLHIALEDFRNRPLGLDDLEFLNHLRCCCRYLARQEWGRNGD